MMWDVPAYHRAPCHLDCKIPQRLLRLATHSTDLADTGINFAFFIEERFYRKWAAMDIKRSREFLSLIY
ncbi:hypothetical protein TNCV_1374751 [Trichonephila clavipes]|nr:hypothetical protein TNCV_1374751 [Trichonephila clavipes]